MGIAEKMIDQLPPGVPRNAVVAEALDLGVTPAELLFARAADLCLFDYVAYRHDHDHEETMAVFHQELEPECLTPVADCGRCEAADLESLEERICHRNA